MPAGKTLPGLLDEKTMNAVPELSVAEGGVQVTTALLPVWTFIVMDCGQPLMTGSVLSPVIVIKRTHLIQREGISLVIAFKINIIKILLG